MARLAPAAEAMVVEVRGAAAEDAVAGRHHPFSQTGETEDDLVAFDPDDFVDALFA